MRVGIVGATGAVGRELVDVLGRRAFPVTSLRLFASARSAGTKTKTPFGEVTIEEFSDAAVRNLDLALLGPRQYPHRADQRLRAGTALRDPFDGLVAVAFALADGAAYQQQGNQQQQHQPADDGEAQQQFEGSHVLSSCGNGDSFGVAGEQGLW